MDKYSREIMTLLKNTYEKTVGKRTFQTGSEAVEFYLQSLEDNLYMPMSVGAKAAYGQGSGNEIASGKMQALRSSSALTYNLFWDQVAEISTENDDFGCGVYQVEFEKQYHTLKTAVSNRPSNLDAFLYNKHQKEAIACEMKMAEWLFNTPGTLRDAYLDPQNYIDKQAGGVFADVAKDLVQQEMKRYDAFQMFKHAVACYTACVAEEPRDIQKLRLVNCVWTISDLKKLSQKYWERYESQYHIEHEEFLRFKTIMTPVEKLFSSIGVNFDICFYTFNEFLDLFHKTPEELQYLRRYTLR